MNLQIRKHFGKRYKAAVNLMELAVVIAIIGIIVSASIVSLQPAKNSSKLKAAQREVASQIKLAQSYALQGRMADNGMGVMVTPCGYGFRFDSADPNKQKYEIFYNLPTATGNCSAKNADPNFRHHISTGGIDDSQPFESQTLSGGVALSNPDPTDGTNETEIYFTVPHGNIFDNAGAPAVDNEFTFSSGALTKKIKISSGGKITED